MICTIVGCCSRSKSKLKGTAGVILYFRCPSKFIIASTDCQKAEVLIILSLLAVLTDLSHALAADHVHLYANRINIG